MRAFDALSRRDEDHPVAPPDMTGLLLEWSAGSDDARRSLIPLLYREMRRLAGRAMRAERRDHTLQPTALVHETWLKLIDQDRVQWRNRAHFFGVAAGLMRRILVDHARRRSAQRRSGEKVALPDELAAPQEGVDVVALDGALVQLAALDETQARIVELRFFGGLTLEETAEAVGVSRATVCREWDMARAWLHAQLAAAD
jgi:RNA polymerase sigma factor (TIGR02999 family)